jgi:hypothetical protein
MVGEGRTRSCPAGSIAKVDPQLCSYEDVNHRERLAQDSTFPLMGRKEPGSEELR